MIRMGVEYDEKELLQIAAASTDYLMFTVGGKGYTIIQTDDGPNIGEWGCKTGGITFTNTEELLEQFYVDGQKLLDLIRDMVVTDWC